MRLRGSSVRGLPVLVDADEFGRALRNLVTNAIRHTPSEGMVEVQGDLHRGMACVSVVDACGGIPPEALPRVFDVAFRGGDGPHARPGQQRRASGSASPAASWRRTRARSPCRTSPGAASS